MIDAMGERSSAGQMSDAHKAALAQGRAEGRIVRNYLEAVRANRPRRGRRRTAASITTRLTAIAHELEQADALQQLLLIQERLDLQAELDGLQTASDISAIEAEFVSVAASYSARNRVGYAAWRAVGVPAAVLKAAGISRAS